MPSEQLSSQKDTNVEKSYPLTSTNTTQYQTITIPTPSLNAIPDREISSSLNQPDSISQLDTAPITPIAVNLERDSVLEPPTQIEQVQAYFQQQWQPPTELAETLEYRLAIDSRGAIKTAIPLGAAAQFYLQQTPIPLTGNAFISPLTDGKGMVIRLVLESDGTVKTFLE